MPRISAGRVQSVATKLIVEKERERMALSQARGGISTPPVILDLLRAYLALKARK